MRNTLVRSQLARAVGGAIVAGYAVVAAAATQIPPNRTITLIGAYGNVGYVVFTPAVPNLEGCPYAVGDQVIFDWTADPNAKVMYATALAAYASGREGGLRRQRLLSRAAQALAYRIDVTQ